MGIIREWYKHNNSSSSNRSEETITLGQGYTKTKQNDTKWRSFWRKIKLMESTKKHNINKKSYKISSSSVRLQSSNTCYYDQTTYSKNFDQGMGWEEPDYLSRSFSARFADPSRLFPKSTIVLLD